MTNDTTKQNPSVEVESGSEAELNEETLEQMSGGKRRFELRFIPTCKPEEPSEPKDGGATGGW